MQKAGFLMTWLKWSMSYNRFLVALNVRCSSKEQRVVQFMSHSSIVWARSVINQGLGREVWDLGSRGIVLSV